MNSYESLKTFIRIYTETIIDVTVLPEDQRPMHLLAQREKRSMAQAKRAVRVTAADVISNLADESAQTLAEFSARLAAANAPTIASVRAMVSKKLEKVVSRGAIKSEEEFYLVKDLLDSPSLPDDERRKLEIMLDAFEFSSR
jgi:polyhydroxyalkanoate synthesis regulator phasin